MAGTRGRCFLMIWNLNRSKEAYLYLPWLYYPEFWAGLFGTFHPGQTQFKVSKVCHIRPLSGYAILISTYTITLLNTLNYILLEIFLKIHFPNMIRKQVSIALVDVFKHCYSSQASAHKPSSLPPRSDAQTQFPASCGAGPQDKQMKLGTCTCQWNMLGRQCGSRGSYSTKSSSMPL